MIFGDPDDDHKGDDDDEDYDDDDGFPPDTYFCNKYDMIRYM